MKKIKNLFTVFGIILVVWIIASWVDINCHNDPFTNDYQDYSSWNYFNLIF